ncbi:MAG: lipopolysaccharide core heptose(II) kinase RfaY [Marinobacter sp.]|uniref:lipopolysaccharide core heptose(II) kinase RfaY n=1 Tax=Marinobacter sp. TaxID=50741 RepID=UPI00349FE7B3
MFSLFDYRHYHVVSHLDEMTSRQLLDAVLDDGMVPEKVFRDNWRTLSAKVRFHSEAFLLKVPRARNGRRWERFLTRFRESDALRTFRHLELMSSMGFAAPEPVLACESRQSGVVTDSFVCYRFVEGRAAGPEDAHRILASMQELHQRGYLRSDAQIANFLMAGETVTFIDFRLKKPWFLPKLQKTRELHRFLRSCPEARHLLSSQQSSSGWYRAAACLEDANFRFRGVKNRIRARRKSIRQTNRK